MNKTFRRRADELVSSWSKRPPHLRVGGLDVESESHASTAVLSPATGEHVGRCPSASATDVERAVAVAVSAQDALRRLDAAARRERVAKVARYLENEAEDLMVLHCLETGRTVRHVRRHDVDGSIATVRYHAGWASKVAGEHLNLGGLTGTTEFVPAPVVGVVVEEREPFAALVRKCAPLWTAGSAVVAVVPESSPFAAIRLAELVHEAGLPPGSFNVLSGSTAAIEALAQSRQVDALSASVGVDRARRLLVLSAKSNLKPVRLEVGGGTSAVVFDDASLRQACRVAVFRGLGSAGLDRFGLQRVFIQRSVYSEMASAITHQARAMVQGDPLDEHSEVGAVPSEAWMKQTLAYVQLGRREGCKLVAGGGRHVDGEAAQGYFVQPTVLVEGQDSMRVVREDVGGPVLVLIPFDDEAQVIQTLNDLEHDAGVSVWSQSVDRAGRVARRLHAPVVWLNAHGGFHPALTRSGRRLGGDHRDGGRLGQEQFGFPKVMVSPVPEV